MDKLDISIKLNNVVNERERKYADLRLLEFQELDKSDDYFRLFSEYRDLDKSYVTLLELLRK